MNQLYSKYDSATRTIVKFTKLSLRNDTKRRIGNFNINIQWSDNRELY